jgi:hypothetical protein
MVSPNELKRSVLVDINPEIEQKEDSSLLRSTTQSSLSLLKDQMTASNNETQDASTAKKLNLYVSNLDINLKTL